MTLPSIDAHAHVDVEINPRELSALKALVLAVTRSLEEGAAALGRSDAMTLWGLGCHPAFPEAVAAFDVERFAALLPRAAFVGEVGLDGKSRVPIERQRQVLGQILDLVGRTPRAVSLHATGAATPLLDVLEQHPVRFPILHWWRGSASETTRALRLGAFFSLNGHEAKSSKVLELIPLERVLTETDFPFSQRYDPGADRPSAVATIENALASHHRVTVDELRRHMWSNLAPLIDTVPDGGASDALRSVADSARRRTSNAPHSLGPEQLSLESRPSV